MVECEGHSGGLAMFWKKKEMITVLVSSRNFNLCIDYY